MNTYCLTIKVRSRNEALLNNLLVTVEALDNQSNEIEMLEMYTAAEAMGQLEGNNDSRIEYLNKEMFLECWMINEE